MIVEPVYVIEMVAGNYPAECDSWLNPDTEAKRGTGDGASFVQERPNQAGTMRARGVSSDGRAPALQAGGHRFDPGTLHDRKHEETRHTHELSQTLGSIWLERVRRWHEAKDDVLHSSRVRDVQSR
jgi:hypothetical protein